MHYQEISEITCIRVEVEGYTKDYFGEFVL